MQFGGAIELPETSDYFEYDLTLCALLFLSHMLVSVQHMTHHLSIAMALLGGQPNCTTSLFIIPVRARIVFYEGDGFLQSL